MNKSIAIITARGGSKRIPGKNTRSFLGKPIIEYSIQAAQESGLFDEIMVSTDSDEIASIASRAGASIPFKRSADNSNDFATTADVLIEVLNWYSEKKINYEYGCCIYPTAPFTTGDKLKRAFDLITTSKADTVFPITEYPSSIWRAYEVTEGKLKHFWPENANKRSQDLPPAYYDCGQFYFFNTEKFNQNKSLITTNSIGIEVPETEVQDIDTEKDWLMAELKFLQAFHPERINSIIK